MSETDMMVAGVTGAALMVYYLVVLIVAIFMLVVLWKVFVKAEEPGWAAIVPFYNTYVLFKITFGNGWFFLLSFIPVVGSIALLVAYFKLASVFGKGTGFGLGLVFLNPIFLAILAFGDADYVGIN